MAPIDFKKPSLAIPTAIALAITFGGPTTGSTDIVPSKTYHLEGQLLQDKYNLTHSDVENTYAMFDKFDESKQKSQIMIDFVSKLVESSVDIDPKILDIVDEDFWDLL